MTAVLQETYELYVEDDRYAVPTLLLISARSEAEAMETAWRVVAESIHHRGAELCLGGRRLAGIGSFAIRELPDVTRGRARG